MRTTLRLKKLEKLSGIVELLQRAYNNAEAARSDLYLYDHAPSIYAPIRLFNTREKLSERRIHWLTVAQRLEQYYDNTAQGLFDIESAAHAG